MPPGRIAVEVLQACPTVRSPQGGPRETLNIIYPILPANIPGSQSKCRRIGFGDGEWATLHGGPHVEIGLP